MTRLATAAARQGNSIHREKFSRRVDASLITYTCQLPASLTTKRKKSDKNAQILKLIIQHLRMENQFLSCKCLIKLKEAGDGEDDEPS